MVIIININIFMENNLFSRPELVPVEKETEVILRFVVMYLQNIHNIFVKHS